MEKDIAIDTIIGVFCVDIRPVFSDPVTYVISCASYRLRLTKSLTYSQWLSIYNVHYPCSGTLSYKKTQRIQSQKITSQWFITTIKCDQKFGKPTIYTQVK